MGSGARGTWRRLPPIFYVVPSQEKAINGLKQHFISNNSGKVMNLKYFIAVVLNLPNDVTL